MTAAASPPPSADDIERLLAALAGVLSARVVVGPAGHPIEIHVLASSGLHPKQVVRNVESALNAGLGLNVDRRVISVAQADAAVLPGSAIAPPTANLDARRNGGGSAARASSAPHPPESSAAPAASVEGGRLAFISYDVTSHAAQDAVCRVVLRGGGEDFCGVGEGPDTPQGRCEAGGRALFAALAAARGNSDVALEGVTLLETHGRTYVLVAAHALHGRGPRPLVGIATLGRSVEEAAVLAALQATNRWIARH
jgi:hypothetical protein